MRNKNQGRLSFVALLLAAGCAWLLSGCATPTKLAFAADPKTPPKPDEQIFLMTANFRNIYHTSHQMNLLVVHVQKPGATEKKDRINFTMDKSAKAETGSAELGNSYYLSMKLPPGNYVIEGFTCLSRSFPTQTFFFAPLHTELNVAGPGVFYLGHVDARVRERQDNEFKAGPSVPLIDQAVGGASGGTFDIELSDQWDADREMFVSRFPALTDVAVVKAVLPPFDRARAQEWWEKH